MKIGLVGWYGHGNAGDERMLQCLRTALSGHDVIWTDRVDLDNLRRRDLVIFGGGSQFVAQMDGWLEAIRAMQGKVICLGVGVESRTRENSALLDYLVERCEFIYVRDARSRHLLENRPNVIVGPDLTFLDPLPVTDWKPGSRCAFNLREWPYWALPFRSPADRFMRKWDPKVKMLRKIYPLRRWVPEQVIQTLNRLDLTISPWPLQTCDEELTDDTREMSRLLGTEVGECDVLSASACSIVVSMRLHGLIFATQMGIPFVSLSYEPKSHAYCEEVGLPWASVPVNDLTSLESAIRRSQRESQEVRSLLLRYRSDAHQMAQTILAERLGPILS